jgi:hypothetical protein
MRHFFSSPSKSWILLFTGAAGAALWGACSEGGSGTAPSGSGASGSAATTTTNGASGAGGATSTTSSGAAGSTTIGTGGTAGSGAAGSTGAGGTSGGASGSSGAGGKGGAGGGAGTGGTAGAGGTGSDGGIPGNGSADVTQHHRNPSRDGVYVDAAFTKAKAATIHRDTTFTSPAIQGPTYAQPLYVENVAGGKNLVVVATEQNWIYGLDAANGTAVWQRQVSMPAQRSSLPCGNMMPTVGITGTPVIDAATKTLYFDALTSNIRHMIYAVSLDDGMNRAGWPIDVSAVVPGFTSQVQSQRGALALIGGTLYVAYGGFWGDCGNYKGWVVGVPTNTPTLPKSYSTSAQKSGIWGPGGIASDGTELFVTTGNAPGGSGPGQQEAVVRLQSGPAFTNANANYFAPSNWREMDDTDKDLGGSGPVLVDVTGATPSKLAVQLSKQGIAYLLDRTSLGGIGTAGNDGIHSLKISNDEIIQAAAAYTTAQSTYVAFKGNGMNCASGSGDLSTLKISAASPPRLSMGWCAQGGGGSPMVTTTDGKAEAIVWQLATGGATRLRGFDGDTGMPVFNGGAAGDQMGSVQGFNSAIAARGRVFVAGNAAVYAFTMQ